MLLLQNGRLVQEGSPASIYHNPCNSWVASFIGEANFLPFEIIKHLLHITSDDAQKPHAKTTVMIRPENCIVSKVEDENQADGTIQKIIFAGDKQTLQVMLKSQHQINVNLPSIQIWETAQKIKIKASHYLFFDTP